MDSAVFRASEKLSRIWVSLSRAERMIELTAAGQLFLVTARTVVEQLGEVLRHLHHLEGGQGGGGGASRRP